MPPTRQTIRSTTATTTTGSVCDRAGSEATAIATPSSAAVFGSSVDGFFVITRKRTGIGSDLASAAGGYALAVRTGRDLVIDWRESLYLREPDNLFGRLFDVPEQIGPCRIVVPEHDVEPDLSGRTVRFGKHDAHDLDEELRHSGPSLAHHSLITSTIHDSRHWRLQQTFLAALTPKPHVVDRIESFWTDAMRGRVVAGIHIRDGNGENLLFNRSEFFRRGLGHVFASVRQFLDAADPRPDRILICSDSRLVRERCRSEFGNVAWFGSDIGEPGEGRIHTSARGIRGAEEAVIEMWLLARCDFLLFNPSWFSYYAQSLGQFRAPPLNLDGVSAYGSVQAWNRKVERARRLKTRQALSPDRQPAARKSNAAPEGDRGVGLLESLHQCLGCSRVGALYGRLAKAGRLIMAAPHQSWKLVRRLGLRRRQRREPPN
jgi:hypothetical protein